MQTKLQDGSIAVSGKAIKDAEYKIVGAKNSPIASFTINAGKRKDTTTIFINCKAWWGLGDYAANIKKGDAVYAIGKVEDREYNGKTYSDLSCEWLNFVSCKHESAPVTGVVVDGYKPTVSAENFEELDEDGEKLPF